MDNKEKIYKLKFPLVYKMLVQKAERKGRTKEEVDEIIMWLTGYSKSEIREQIEKDVDYREFFASAPKINPNINLIKGSICGVKIENIEDDIVKQVRCLDKLIDELAKGKTIEKILRK